MGHIFDEVTPQEQKHTIIILMTHIHGGAAD
jgi:hypothetical protein